MSRIKAIYRSWAIPCRIECLDVAIFGDVRFRMTQDALDNLLVRPNPRPFTTGLMVR